MTEHLLTTDRLILRRWQSSDREPFARLNADPRVMEFLPALLSRAESDSLVDRVESHFRDHGFGPFAVELKDNAAFLGFTGLYIPTFEAAFTPCVEIGWRLSADCWGQGFATEAARAVVRYAFDELALKELVSFTSTGNRRSRRVMEKLGMTYDPTEDFNHPRLPDGHPLQRHVLCRLRPT